MFKLDLQSLSVSIDEGLEEGFVMGNGLQDVPVCRHVTDRPLSQPGAAQPEDVAEIKDKDLNPTGTANTHLPLGAQPLLFGSHLPGLWMNLCSRALTSSYVRKAM